MTAHSEVLYNAKMRLNEDANRYRIARAEATPWRADRAAVSHTQRTGAGR